ncbi:MAG TPA: hypothetical protein VN719_09535 [Gemmatimonadales bacterium]|nr:hypothetical protein [Gemmatimonadales bacterium]
MALSVTEAHAVNTLFQWLLDIEHQRGISHPTKSQAMEAAGLLADHANKTLMAGVRGVQVREAWLRKFED